MSDQDRIDELASQVRRLRWMNFGMAAVITAGAMLAAGAVHQVSPIVKTKRIEIVADDGKTVLALGSDPAGGTLELFNASGEKVAELGVTEGGGGLLTTYNGKGQKAAVLGASPIGAVLGICNDKGQAVAALMAGPEGGRLGISNDKGERAATLMAGPEGGKLTTFDEEGQQIGRLP
jgi:hypothetical protein